MTQPAFTSVSALYRYPVKGLSPQAESHLRVVVGEGVPSDRRYALALGSTRFDPREPEPLDKGCFLMLRRDTALASLRTRFDWTTHRLGIERPGDGIAVYDLGTAEGRAATETFFLDFIGEACEGRPRLVEAPGHKFTDVSVMSPEMMRAVSLINLASVRDLGNRCGVSLDPRRFRANIYIDGLAAWEELDWVGRDVEIGTSRLRGVLRTRRCAAVDVDPETATRDTSLPKALVRNYGHPDCGIYLEVLRGGAIRLADRVVPRPAG